jgi:hypothetical protein
MLTVVLLLMIAGYSGSGSRGNDPKGKARFSCPICGKIKLLPANTRDPGICAKDRVKLRRERR